jgi:hypothetical protein
MRGGDDGKRALLDWHARRDRRRTARARELAHRAAVRLKSTTAFARLRPTFLVIGEQKCGTSALYAYLLSHPHVFGCLNKEVHFFDRHYACGIAWYAAHFPLRAAAKAVRRPVVGEASPGYFASLEAPERIRRFDPDLRLIVLFRDPVDRAYSFFKIAHEAGNLDSFDAFVDRALARGDDAIVLQRGRYLDHLQRWHRHFDPEQLLVVRTEDLRERPQETLDRTFEHLGLTPHALSSFPKVNAVEGPEMPAGPRLRLQRYFDEPNQRLYEYLGRDLGWSRPDPA